MSTPHISAAPGQFAETVLMPGDPLRARWIAETYLDGAECVTEVRGMLGYTGTFEGAPISVMGSGMGVPSISIYATELARHFGVRRIVRIGSCGALPLDVALGDVIVVTGAATDSTINQVRSGGFELAAIPDFDTTSALVAAAREVAATTGVSSHVGPVVTSDTFYDADPHRYDRMGALGHLAVEMEAAGLFGVGMEESISTGAMLTVSDHLYSDAHLSADERQSGFATMVKAALVAMTA